MEKWYQHLSSRLLWKCPHCAQALALSIPKEGWQHWYWRPLLIVWWIFTLSFSYRLIALLGFILAFLILQFLAAQKRTLTINTDSELSLFDKEEIADTDL